MKAPSAFYLLANGRDAVLSLAPGMTPVRWTRVTSLQRVDVGGRALLLVMGNHPGQTTGLAAPLSVLAVVVEPRGRVESVLAEGPVLPATLTPAGRLALENLA